MTVRRPFRRLGLGPGEAEDGRRGAQEASRFTAGRAAWWAGSRGEGRRGQAPAGVSGAGRVDAGAIHPAPTEVQAAQAAIMTLVSDPDSGFGDIRSEVLEAAQGRVPHGRGCLLIGSPPESHHAQGEAAVGEATPQRSLPLGVPVSLTSGQGRRCAQLLRASPHPGALPAGRAMGQE